MDFIITGFKKDSPRAGKIWICINGHPWYAAEPETVLRERLAEGQKLTEKRQAEVLMTDEFVRARKAAGIHAAQSPKTMKEIDEFLELKGFGPETRRRVLESLAEIGVADDEKAAGRIARIRRRRGGVGPARVEAELRGRGIDETVAQTKAREAYAGANTAAECEALARRIAAKYEPLAEPRQRHKLVGFLLRRGFGDEEAQEAVKKLAAERGIDDSQLP